MVDRLEIAKRFVRKLVEERADIVGVLLCGSTARGEASEASDIDLSVYTEEENEQGTQNLAYWESGVFIDLVTTTTKGLGSLEQVMGNPIDATHMNDALPSLREFQRDPIYDIIKA